MAIWKWDHNSQIGKFIHIMAILNIIAWPDMAVKMAKRYVSYEYKVDIDHLWKEWIKTFILWELRPK